MAGGYDGSIRIDTRIDGKGFNNGVQDITGSLKKLAAAVGIAFGVEAILNFSKTAVDAASEMSSAFIGLQSVVEGQGRSFGAAKAFIDEYIRDGLVPATDAVTAYKNLAARGYSDPQIEKTLIALKDSASFGRQASLSLGDAVKSASEGLKNENSILVDNAGVTKNVSLMWKDYATSIGTTADKLTKQQKIQAEVNGILEESRFQVGDAAKLAGTYSGQVSALGVSFNNLKVALGNALIPLLTAIIPYVRAAIEALTSLFVWVAAFVSSLFGIQTAVAGAVKSTQKTAEVQKDLGKEVDKTTKAVKGQLAAFDELNVLQQPDATDNGGGGGGAGGDITVPIIPVIDTNKSFDQISAQVEAFKTKLLEFLQPAIDAFGRLRDALMPLGQVIWEGLKWGWDNILVPLGKWVISDAFPVFLDLVTGAIKILTEVLIALKPLGQWLWDNFLKGLASWTGQVIIDALKWLVDLLNSIAKWIHENPEGIRALAIVIGIVTVAIIAFQVAAWLVNTALTVVTATIMIAEGASAAFGAVMAFITSPIFLVIAAIAAIIIIIVLLVKNWDWVSQKAGEAWAWIQQAWANAGQWFSNTVVDPIKSAFKSVLDWLGGAWSTVWNGIGNVVKGVVNTIIDFINTMIRAVAGGINAVIGAMNTLHVEIPSWVPFIGGQVWGLNIPPVGVPQIPRLATGAVIPPNAQFAAILGDQTSGRNIEAPEGLIRQIMQEELGKIQADIRIEFVGSLAALARELKPRIDRENVRIGGNLISGVVTV